MQILIYFMWSNTVYTQFYNAATLILIANVYFKFVNAGLRF
jgi:hypothetical protein